VPKRIAAHVGRTEIRISTQARERRAALRTAVVINAALEAEWEQLLKEAAPARQAAVTFASTLAEAQRLGITYQPAIDIAAGRLEDILTRIERLAQPLAAASAGNPIAPAPKTVSAMLGGAGKPELKLSDLVEAYQKLASDQAIGKSEKQLKQWKSRHERSVATLIGRIGDKPLADITRADALDFRDWWICRIKNEGYNKNSANKNLGCLSAMMRVVDDAFRLNLSLPFKGLRIAGDKYTRRQAYDEEFVRSQFLARPQIGQLNLEASAIVRMIALTGMRPSEIVALERAHIQLDDAVPHVQIRADGRQLKTDASARDMPLVGLALEIMRDYAAGFPRYRASSDGFSAIANKCLTTAGLRPTRRHTVYSLRHSFKDRMIAVGVPERIQDELMGHALKGMAYGEGATLKHRAEWMAKLWG
jgi:integrase